MSVLEWIQGYVCYALYVAKLSYKCETFNKLKATLWYFPQKKLHTNLCVQIWCDSLGLKSIVL